MRKILLLFTLTLLFTGLSAQIQQKVVFNFTDYKTLSTPIKPSPVHGGVVNITKKTFSTGLITVSFDALPNESGAQYVTISDSPSDPNAPKTYFVRLNRGAHLKFKTEGKVALDQIMLSMDSKKGDLEFKGNQPGAIDFESIPFVWNKEHNDSVRSVEFWTAGSDSEIKQITVKYTMPSDILEPTSDISNGSVLKGFKQINLTFENPMTAVNASDLKLKRADGQTTPLTATVKGNRVTLAAADSLLIDGDYELQVPAGKFKDKNGLTNKALLYKFKIDTPKDILVYKTVTPLPGKLMTLNSPLVLAYDKPLDQMTATVALLRDGHKIGDVTIKRDPSNAKQVLLTLSVPTTQRGVYTIAVPEHTILDQSKKIYNPEFTLTYKVGERPTPVDSDTMKSAKSLLELTGYGYPAADSPARLALQQMTTANPAPNDNLVKQGIANFIAEKKINLPHNGEYCKLVGVSQNGQKLYLSYSDGKIKVVKSQDEAYTFKVRVNADQTLSFETDDHKFMHVLMPNGNYNGTSANNVTADANAKVIKLSVRRLAGDQMSADETFGRVSIYGSIGTNRAGQEKSTYTLLAYPSGDIISSTEYNQPYYLPNMSSAFILEPSVAGSNTPVQNVPYTIGNKVIGENNPHLNLKFNTQEHLFINAEAEKPYVIGKDGQKKQINAELKNGTNILSIDPAGLKDGDYQLFIPEGYLSFTKGGKNVKVANVNDKFTVANEHVVDGQKFKEDYTNFGISPDGSAGVRIMDTDLNNFTISAVPDLYSDMILAPNKTVYIRRYSNSELIAKGHFVREISSETGAPVLRLVLDKPIAKGSLRSDDYTIVIDAATWGDANYGKYLNGDPAIRPSDCNVNPKFTFTYKVDNAYVQGIDQVDVDGRRQQVIYDLNGRRLQRITQPGVYIINGKKVVVDASTL